MLHDHKLLSLNDCGVIYSHAGIFKIDHSLHFCKFLCLLSLALYYQKWNQGKISLRISKTAKIVLYTIGNGNGNENISNAPPTVDRRHIT